MQGHDDHCLGESLFKKGSRWRASQVSSDHTGLPLMQCRFCCLKIPGWFLFQLCMCGQSSGVLQLKFHLYTEKLTQPEKLLPHQQEMQNDVRQNIEKGVFSEGWEKSFQTCGYCSYDPVPFCQWTSFFTFVP
jgi:hypothetical protein